MNEQWKVASSRAAGHSLDTNHMLQASENGDASANGDAAAVSEAAGVAPGQQLRIKRDKALILFGGTRILQHTGDKHARIRTPDDGCLAVVLRTGFETAQGGVLKWPAVQLL